MSGTAVQREPAASSDITLLAAVLSGSLGSYEGIMRHHNQRLFRLARSIVTDYTEAAGIEVHEIAGARCDAIVGNVMATLRTL